MARIKHILKNKFLKPAKVRAHQPQITALLQQALTLHHQRKFEDARVIYEKLLQLQPNHFDALQLLGALFTETHQYVQAVDFLSRAVQIEPGFAEPYSNRGNALQELGRLEEALSSYEQAIMIKPAYAEAYSNRANALKQLGRLDEALASADKAISLKPDYPEAHSHRGNILKEMGRLDEALASYDKAISINPDYAQAHSNRGSAQSHQPQITALLQQALTLHHQRKFEDARVIYEKLLQLQPNHFDALQLLGALFTETHQYVQAVDFLSRAVQIEPGFAEPYSNRGNALQELGRLEEALSSYEQAIMIKPAYAEAYSNRANALKQLGRLDEALASADKAISLKPDYPEAHSHRGNILKEMGRLDEALASYDMAISINSDYAEAYANRGIPLQELGRLEEAIASFDKAISLKTNFPEAYANRGIPLQELGRLEEAIASFDKAISLKTNFPEAYANRGNTLQGLGRLDEALTSYDQAISIKPDYAEAFANRSVALQDLGRMDEAIVSCTKAINIKPDYPDANWNLSLFNLLMGNYIDGWKGHEWRRKNSKLPSFKEVKNFSQPLWLGETSLQDKTIFIHAEQGLGDTIQFSRYVPLLAQLGAKVILEVQSPLLGLLENLEGANQVIARGEKLPPFEYHCPIMSLPLAFKTEVSTIPPVTQSIASSNEKVMKWKAILGNKSNPRIGLVWSGNPAHKNDRNRSLSFSEIAPYLPSGIEYICMQKEIRAIDHEQLKKNDCITYFGDSLQDFTDTAALCELMDVVISVDTSVAHLAATLGKPTWILLPFRPDWRWLLGIDYSPWYPSATLFRQERIGKWDSVFETVQSRLLNLVS